MGNNLDIRKSLKDHADGFECHGLRYPPSYQSVKGHRDESKSYKAHNEADQMRRRRKRSTSEGWTHFQYPIDNVVLSGGGSKGYAFVGALKVRASSPEIDCLSGTEPCMCRCPLARAVYIEPTQTEPKDKDALIGEMSVILSETPPAALADRDVTSPVPGDHYLLS